MMEKKQRDELLALAISSIGSPDFPNELTEFIRHCIPFDNLIVIAYEGEQQPCVLYRESKSAVVYEAMDSDYVTGAYLLDPFYKLHLQGVNTGLYRLFDIAPDRFKQTSYFKVYYQKTTLIDEVAVFAKTVSGGTLTTCIGTDKTSKKAFSKKDIISLRNFSAVICSLMESHWQNYQRSDFKQDDDTISVVEYLRKEMKNEMKIGLSKRQTEVALFILQGHSSRSIGLILEISVNTVKIFRRQLYSKCNISSQAELFALMMPLLSMRI